MGTNIRTNLAKTNRYYISKHRRLELTHFCLQYPEWRDYLKEYHLRYGNDEFFDPTAEEAMIRVLYSTYIDLVIEIAKISGGEIWEYLLEGVTKGSSYKKLYMVNNIPCSKDYYYERLHKFYYILSRKMHGI